MLRFRLCVLGLLLAAAPLRAATVASVFSGRIPCTVVQGVQFAMPGAKVKPRVTQVRLAEGNVPKEAQPETPSASQATLAAR